MGCSSQFPLLFPLTFSGCGALAGRQNMVFCEVFGLKTPFAAIGRNGMTPNFISNAIGRNRLSRQALRHAIGRNGLSRQDLGHAIGRNGTGRQAPGTAFGRKETCRQDFGDAIGRNEMPCRGLLHLFTHLLT